METFSKWLAVIGVAMVVSATMAVLVSRDSGNFAGVTHLSGLSLGANGLEIIDGGTTTVGASGTATSKMKWGTCTIHSTATTIAASSTAEVSCQGGASALTAISGITAGDAVFVQQPTTTPTTFGGLKFLASASSTAGYIHMKVINNTGGTFTWTSAASSSIPYLVFDN